MKQDLVNMYRDPYFVISKYPLYMEWEQTLTDSYNTRTSNIVNQYTG